MTELLTTFGGAFANAGAWALPAALAWGMLSVFLSPCHLSSIPLVVAYMNGGGEPPATRRATTLSASFALGTLGSIAAVGAVTLGLGRIAGDVGRLGSYLLAAVFLAMGLNLLGVLPLPTWSTPDASAHRGARGALVLGLVFGAALGPCSFAFMAPLLGLAFASGHDRAGHGAALVALYAFGHAAAIVIAGTSAQGVQRWLSWKSGGRASGVLRGTAGTAVILGGLYFLATAP
jgi:cytochrome c-type biogenesis protein